MIALFLTADGVEDSDLLVPFFRILEEWFVVDIGVPDGGSLI
jgi:hypothetical protein